MSVCHNLGILAVAFCHGQLSGADVSGTHQIRNSHGACMTLKLIVRNYFGTINYTAVLQLLNGVKYTSQRTLVLPNKGIL